MLLQLSHFFPFIPLCPEPHSHQHSSPHQFLSMGHTYKFFGFCIIYTRCVKLIFTRGCISLVVAFKGLNVILGLCKCNYSLTVKPELGTATGQKQGSGPYKIRWQAGFGPQALCLPLVIYTILNLPLSILYLPVMLLTRCTFPHHSLPSHSPLIIHVISM